MTTDLYGIRNCDTVKKARTWLADAGVAYVFHDFKLQGVDAARLAEWVERVGWEQLLNRAGTTFRKLDEADRADIDADKAMRLMIAHPSVIKRPVIVHGDDLLVGFKSDTYAAAFC